MNIILKESIVKTNIFSSIVFFLVKKYWCSNRISFYAQSKAKHTCWHRKHKIARVRPSSQRNWRKRQKYRFETSNGNNATALTVNRKEIPSWTGFYIKIHNCLSIFVLVFVSLCYFFFFLALLRSPSII